MGTSQPFFFLFLFLFLFSFLRFFFCPSCNRSCGLARPFCFLLCVWSQGSYAVIVAAADTCLIIYRYEPVYHRRGRRKQTGVWTPWLATYLLRLTYIHTCEFAIYFCCIFAFFIFVLLFLLALQWVAEDDEYRRRRFDHNSQ